MRNAGFVVLILGLILTIFTTIEVVEKEKVVDIGRLEITKEKPTRRSWSPWLGVAVMGIGGLMLMQAYRKK
jgi:hypothetical protein